MDFTDLDITKTWGPAGLKRYYSDRGATPISASGQGVQLALSGDKGIALGPELVASPLTTAIFTAGGDVTFAQNGSFVNMTRGAGGVGSKITLPNLVSGKRYLTQGKVSLVSGSGVNRIFLDTSGGLDGTSIISLSGTFSAIAGLTGVSSCQIWPDASTTVAIESLSIREVLGNHAYQSTSGSRPQWQTGNKLVFDNIDDCLATGLIPTSTFTLIAKVDVPATISATQIIAGANDAASANRCFLALDTSGRVCGGVGSQSVTTILGSNDLRGTTKVLALTLDGSTVKLYEIGAQVYSAAQAGVPTSTNAIYIGANNNAGAAANFFGGSIKAAGAFKGCLTPSEISYLTNLMGTS